MFTAVFHHKKSFFLGLKDQTNYDIYDIKVGLVNRKNKSEDKLRRGL